MTDEQFNLLLAELKRMSDAIDAIASCIKWELKRQSMVRANQKTVRKPNHTQR
jgi:hypothetical protein